MKPLRYLATLSLLLSLAACGFHLRGSIEIPPWFRRAAIVNEGVHKDMMPLLKDQLQAYCIQIQPDLKQAEFLIVLIHDSAQQQITNISASTTPRQYQLIYTISFQVLKKSGQVLVPPNQVVSIRQLTVNNDRILGSDAEEATIFSEMRRDASIQIMDRISRRLAEVRNH